jgi:UDP-N-acetyl-D-galactosamine dehydrogenase
VAEAAKVIENTQRDLNIALMNELAMLFAKLGLDTGEVLEAAGTKWNFLPFRPGLVGGHCIPVDPYYLAHKASEVGFYPDVILAGRRVNEGMGFYVAECVAKAMALAGKRNPEVLILGLTFKEDCPDTRNTKVIDIVHGLQSFGMTVYVSDPLVTPGAAKELGVDLVRMQDIAEYYQLLDAIVLAVPHQEFLAEPEKLREYLKPDGMLFDVKSALPRDLADWRL